jgi:hypothetical protein
LNALKKELSVTFNPIDVAFDLLLDLEVPYLTPLTTSSQALFNGVKMDLDITVILLRLDRK